MATYRADLDLDLAFSRAAMIAAMDGEPAAITFLQKWHRRRREILGLPQRASEGEETGEEDPEDEEDAGED